MKKKGFTLIELLAVIVIISVLGLLVVPSVIKYFNETIRKNMKIQENQILDAANVYINDNCSRHASLSDKNECKDSMFDLAEYCNVSLRKYSDIGNAIILKRIIDHSEVFGEFRMELADYDLDGQLTENDYIKCLAEEGMNVNDGHEFIPDLKKVCFCTQTLEERGLIDEVYYRGNKCKGLIHYTYKEGELSKGKVILKCEDGYSNFDNEDDDVKELYYSTGCFN